MKGRKNIVGFVTVAAGCFWFLTAVALNGESIRNSIEETLGNDRYLSDSDITVTEYYGKIIVSGNVDSLSQKRRAEALIKDMRRVSDLENKLVIEPAFKMTDEQIEGNLRDTLLLNPAADGHKIDTEVSDGLVALKGTVNTLAQKNVIERVASQVNGIREIENQIEVSRQIERNDSGIEADIREYLAWDQSVPSQNVAVKVKGGVAYVSGTVPTLKAKEDLREIIGRVRVDSIDSTQLRIGDRPERTEKKSDDEAAEGIQVEEPTDMDIQNAVQRRLGGDPEIFIEDLNVIVVDRVVELRGRVDSLRDLRDAQMLAHYVRGVDAVANHLTVSDSDLRDEEIQSLAYEGLKNNTVVGQMDIHATFEEGILTLEGEVDTNYEKAQAEVAVAGIDGVKEISNELSVTSPATLLNYDPAVDPWVSSVYSWYGFAPKGIRADDAEVKKKIMTRIDESLIEDPDAIDVVVEDGLVTLMGHVNSKLESDYAESSAYKGGGVVVNNYLTVVSRLDPAWVKNTIEADG